MTIRKQLPAGDPRPYHHGKLAEALVDATFDIVREKGIEGVSVREAARRVDVSSSAPFKHFRSRADLMLAVVDKAVESLRMAVEASFLSQSDPLDCVRAAGNAYLAWSYAHPVHMQIITASCTSLPRSADAQHQIDEMTGYWFAWFGAAAALGALRGDPDPSIAAVASGAQLYGLSSAFAEGRCVSPAMAADPLTTMKSAFALHLANLRS
jgi:AcrR family transcriptional regulator